MAKILLVYTKNGFSVMANTAGTLSKANIISANSTVIKHKNNGVAARPIKKSWPFKLGVTGIHAQEELNLIFQEKAMQLQKRRRYWKPKAEDLLSPRPTLLKTTVPAV